MFTIAAIAASDGQGWRQVGELGLAFGLSSIIGLERQLRAKSAGLRTQAIVGTASALFLLVSKYGFGNVLLGQVVVLDPSRVAAQIVSGIGFLGAGLIITHRGTVRGLTTAASVWETAAIGMAAGAGLPLLALLVTALQFVIVMAYTPMARLITRRGRAERDYTVTYEDGRGVLRELLTTCSDHSWTINSMAITARREGGGLAEGIAEGQRLVTIALTLSGPRVVQASSTLGAIDGVFRVDLTEEEDD